MKSQIPNIHILTCNLNWNLSSVGHCWFFHVPKDSSCSRDMKCAKKWICCGKIGPWKDNYLRMAMERYVKAVGQDNDCQAAANGIGMVFARRGKPEIVTWEQLESALVCKWGHSKSKKAKRIKEVPSRSWHIIEQHLPHLPYWGTESFSMCERPQGYGRQPVCLHQLGAHVHPDSWCEEETKWWRTRDWRADRQHQEGNLLVSESKGIESGGCFSDLAYLQVLWFVTPEWSWMHMAMRIAYCQGIRFCPHARWACILQKLWTIWKTTMKQGLSWVKQPTTGRLTCLSRSIRLAFQFSWRWWASIKIYMSKHHSISLFTVYRLTRFAGLSKQGLLWPSCIANLKSYMS